EWVGGSQPVDHTLELFRREGFAVATAGTKRFRRWWNSASVKLQHELLSSDFDNWISIARTADAEAKQAREAFEAQVRRDADGDSLADPFGRRSHGSGQHSPSYAAHPHP